MEHTQKHKWFYGVYGSGDNYIRPMPLYTYVPTSFQNETPTNLDRIINDFKIDMIWMHDDPQRCQWFKQIPNTPIAYWCPIDNEDWRHTNQVTTLQASDLPVVVAKFAQDALREKFKLNIPQIYNPIDTDFYKNLNLPREELIKILAPHYKTLKPDKHYILWVGRPGWRKRLIHICEIIRKIRNEMGRKDVHLILHMDVNDSIAFRLEELLFAQDLLADGGVIVPDNFNYMQGSPKEIIRALYNLSDVYISPSGGEGMCTIGNTLIKTDDSFKRIDELKIGDYVYNSLNSKKKITKVFNRNYNGNCVKYEPFYNNSVIFTPEHKIYIARKVFGYPIDSYDYIWIEAKDINTDTDYTISNIPHKKLNIKQPIIPISGDNIFWFLGIYMAEGSNNKKVIRLYLHKDELDFVESKLKDIIVKYIHSNQTGILNDYTRYIKIRKKIDGNKGHIEFSSKILSEYLSTFGTRAYNKKIPQDVFDYLCSNEQSRLMFIDGLYYGDGHKKINRDKRSCDYFDIELTSLELLQQLKYLLELDNKIAKLTQSRLERKCKIKGVLYDCHATWRLKWSSNQIFTFIYNNKRLTKIRSKEFVQINEPVYNIEVDGSTFDEHSYETISGIVHNCLPIVESMSCEKPFIATDYSTTQEFAQYPERGKDMIGKCGTGIRIGYLFDDKGIMRPYANLQDFAKEVIRLINDPQLAKTMGKNGRNYVTKEVDKRVIGYKWNKLFENYEVEYNG
jgi:glycosyltransferase involved in cell wall biosynthesis